MDARERVRMGRRRPYRGVTLTEVVVASSLLAISIVPLLKALGTAHVMDRTIERKSWSLMLAQQKLEEIRALSVYHYEDVHGTNSESLRDGYLCTVTDDGNDTLRTIVVSVGFDGDANGVLSAQEIDVSLYTRLARRWPGPL